MGISYLCFPESLGGEMVDTRDLDLFFEIIICKTRELRLLYSMIKRNYSLDDVKKAVKENDLDISHFTGQGWNVGLVYQEFFL